ncbi:ABC transporter permease [Trueperella pyogenes]|uniref:ABC transporter permease n=1 Tax=Trueperella pyogenes TaxID=1661 RepID=UPI00345CD819
MNSHAPGSSAAAVTPRSWCSRAWQIFIGNAAWGLAILLFASAVIFAAMNVLPGDPAVVIGGVDATEEQLARIRSEHGWDRPLVAQYLSWLGGMLTGDFGTSALNGKSVMAELADKLQVTVPLALIALSCAILVALVLGIFAATQGGVSGRLVAGLSQIGIAVPPFVVSIILIIVIAIPSQGLIPATGFPGWGNPGSALLALLLPSLTLAIPIISQLTRFVRSAVLAELSQPYMRTARAQGLSPRAALWQHALRNAWLPLVAVIAVDIAAALTGTVIVEHVFALPGIGQAIVAAVSQRDAVVVQGFLMVLTATIILVMMMADTLVRILDPRTRVMR